ncbi:MAG: hypothetical protein N2260_09970 [Syntrophobacterales bacterium]|nr:hypothetical protein [Syntrophobacterales bacterium]
MQDKRSFHLKVQEMCACYAQTDPLKEMSNLKIAPDADLEEAAVKWIALTLLYGITDQAKKIKLSIEKDGSVSVTAKYYKAELPSPGTEIGKKVIDVIRNIMHLDKPSGELPLTVGIGESSIEVEIELEKEDDREVLEIEFPKTK